MTTGALPTGSRSVALDVFRGATIAAMILVNNPGNWSAVYAPLRHAPWHGCTPTDLVFPFFLFIVGVAIPLSLTRRVESGADRGTLLRRILRRGALLLLLGWLLSAWPILRFTPELGWHENLLRIRIPGVLQRIGICYSVVAIGFLYWSPRRLAQWNVCCLLGYWALLAWFPVPGHGPGRIDDPEQTVVAWLDRLLLSGHMWASSRTWDPEGILSTIPALSTTLFGLATGRLLQGSEDESAKVARMAVRGILLAAAGYIWGWFLPLNKPIWTSSYAVFTAGLAMQALAICTWIVDVRGWRRYAQPFVVYGVNALVVFVLSGLLAKTLGLWRIDGGDGRTVTMRSRLYETLYASWLAPHPASLAFALTWVAGWYVILRWMYRRGIVIRV